MDVVSLLKLVHVFSALAWVGGGLTFAVLANLFVLRGDRAAALTVVTLTAPLGAVWFMPASILTLASGLTLFWVGAWPLDGWSTLALVLVAVVFLIGILVMKPAGERIAALVARGETDAAEEEALKLVPLTRFDGICMVAIVALMVLKPTFADLAVLAVTIGAVALAGVATLGARRSPIS